MSTRGNLNIHDPEPMLTLYTTSGCHLCEQAEALLARAGLAFRPVEIADDPALFDGYALRIPVLHRCDTGAELDWPFDGAALDAWWGLPMGDQRRS